MRETMPATLEAMEAFIEEFRLIRHRCFHNEAALFTAELLLRELLTNAVEHGCRCEPTRNVRCVVRLNGRRLTIVVEDEGSGFDWRARWNRETEKDSVNGRGLEIIREYATLVRFSKKGNSVFVLKHME
jgi:serine/threonine-protein kinase RsbW